MRACASHHSITEKLDIQVIYFIFALTVYSPEYFPSLHFLLPPPTHTHKSIPLLARNTCTYTRARAPRQRSYSGGKSPQNNLSHLHPPLTQQHLVITLTHARRCTLTHTAATSQPFTHARTHAHTCALAIAINISTLVIDVFVTLLWERGGEPEELR